MIQDGSTKIDDWVLRSFGSCAELVRDSVIPEDSKKIPYIGLEHIEEGTLRLSGYGLADEVTSLKSRFRKGDILFGKLRPYFRKVVIAPFAGICSTDIWVVRPQPGTDARFLYYWMASIQFVDDITRASQGTKMPRAKWDFAEQLERYVPQSAEQKAIGEALGILDDKIELNRKMNVTLEKIAQSLFKSWFMDFDPVRANIEARLPEGMNKATASIFPNMFDVIDGREVPNGWEILNLGEVVDIIKGRSYTSEELNESSVALVTLKSFLRGGGYRHDGLKSYTGPYKPEQIVKPKELVISFTDVTQAADVIGKPALVSANPEFDTLVASLDVGIVRPKDKTVTIPFLYLLFKTEEYQSHIYGYTTGTTVLHLDKTGIPKYEFVCPSRDVMEKFSEIVQPIFDLIENNLQQIYILSAIRETLLPKLLSGKIQISDEKSVTRAAG